MRRVTRESSWGKLINKQVTRWVGSRQIDMRAHGTQKTRTEATCSHKTKTQAHVQQTNQQPCAKQDMNTQLMRKLISHVSTQDMTKWKHAADEYTSCVPHSTRYNTNARTLTQRDRTWSVSVRTPSRNRSSKHECRDPNTTLQHETRHADERAHGSSTLEAACSYETQTWREYQSIQFGNLDLKKVLTCNYETMVFMFIQLINTIFPTWLESTNSLILSPLCFC